MIRKICLSTLLLSLFAGVVFAQAPPMPTPAPELKKLDYFAGNWKLEGDAKPGPMGPGGKFSGMEHNEWMKGGFFLVSHSEFKGAGMPDAKGLSVMGYDAAKKVYTYREFNSMGENFSSEGTVEGDNWTWTSEQEMGGQVMTSRFSMKVMSPTMFTIKFEMAPKGSELALAMEGKATKQ